MLIETELAATPQHPPDVGQRRAEVRHQAQHTGDHHGPASPTADDSGTRPMDFQQVV